MKSWEGRSCRKMVRRFEEEHRAAVDGVALDRNGNPEAKGVLPRTLREIDVDLETWRGRLAAPEPEPKAPTAVEHSYTILLPVSGEKFGKWLEDNNATIEISCQLGTYHVCVNRHLLSSRKETGNVSVTRSGDVRISSYDKVFEAALFNATKKFDEELV